jgi:uncharacterized membrane protein YkoI
MSKMMRLFTFTCVCITGLSSFVHAAENSLLSQLPGAVQEVVKREFAEARVTGIDDDDYEGIPVYEIEAETADGRELAIEVGKDGTIYQKDEEVRLKDLPPAVLAAIKKQLGDVGPDDLKRMTEYGKVYYEIRAEGMGKEVELKIETDGTILEKEVNGEKVDDVSSPALGSTATHSPGEPGSDELPLQYLGPDLPDREAMEG